MHMINDEFEIIRQIQKGQSACYKELVLGHQSAVYSLLYTMLRQHSLAEDLTQEVFIKAYENLNRFNFKSRFFSWIYRIAINTAITYRQKEKRMFLVDTDVLVSECSEEEKILENERSMILKKAIEELKEKYRLVIILKYFEQLSYAEIADVLKIPEKKVKSRLFDARKVLKSFLEENGYF